MRALVWSFNDMTQLLFNPGHDTRKRTIKYFLQKPDKSDNKMQMYNAFYKFYLKADKLRFSISWITRQQ